MTGSEYPFGESWQTPCPATKAAHHYVAGSGYHFCEGCGNSIQGPIKAVSSLTINVPPIDVTDITCDTEGRGSSEASLIPGSFLETNIPPVKKDWNLG